MCNPTGRYRVRKGFRGKSILQSELDCPTYNAGGVDVYRRKKVWVDCDFESTSHRTFQQIKQVKDE